MYHAMLVEDDSAVRYVYSRMKSWAKHGFTIEAEASNGLQAMEALEKSRIDVIFTDIRMPFMDGITLMKTVQQNHPDMCFVLVSSYNEFEYAREGLRLGATDYIVKPMSEENLDEALHRVKETLDSKQDYRVLEMVSQCMGMEENLSEEPLIRNLCEFLTANMNRNVTMEEVAATLHLNKDYFGKVIKQKTGQSFKSLYNLIKMDYAKTLIKSGKYKVYEISEQLGYASADYFTKLFKNTTGVTPAEYKKSIQV